ncbi:MAG: M48 family metallopeptidase [Pseudomonadota bacterium]|nr:M48 family metallopeptidase [Pseudomonadota bacterium]
MLTLGDEEVAINLSAMRRKSMRLQLTAAGDVDLRIPLGAARSEVLAFVRKHEHWLLQRRREFLQRQQKKQQSVLIRGRELTIEISALDEFLITDQVVWVPQHWDAAQTEKALDNWLRSNARVDYPRMIERWWPKFSQYAAQRPVLRVKKMRTRWGSLSQRGYINLNLALMQLPESLLELVVVHELCHLRHFDHGAGFKQLMSDCLPDWRQREQQLLAFSRLL